MVDDLAREIYALVCTLDPADYPEDPDEPMSSDDRWMELRVQLHETGDWAFHYGDPGWDTDHRGHWGSGAIPGNLTHLV